MTAPRRLDSIYVTASAHDGRFTRICVASIRHFYPDAPIRLLAGGPLEQGLADELARYWDVDPMDNAPVDWGWGFVKLEPLFGKLGERFLVLDSDTVFGGPVLETWATSSADFLVDDEQQTEEDAGRLYFDWRKLAAVDADASPPTFVFNSGQWFGVAGILSRKDFGKWLDWTNMPPKLRHPDMFMPGDQGVLNYVLNKTMRLDRAKVERRKIMRWPGHGLEGFSRHSVEARSAPPLIIHWAGMKEARLGDMAGADILRFFEAEYYSRLPGGRRRRLAAAINSPVGAFRRRLVARIKCVRNAVAGSA